MALVLDATPSGAASNSYLTRAEGDSYHEGHLYATDWTGAPTAVRDAALVMATRTLEAKYVWASWPTKWRSQGQNLAWPRTGVYDLDQLTLVDRFTIPQRLKEATAEFARQLIAENRIADSDIQTKGLTSLRVGPINMTFKDSVSAKVIPDAVRDLIPKWWGHPRDCGFREVRRA